MDRQKSNFINMRRVHGRVKRGLIQNSVIQSRLRRHIKSYNLKLFDVSIGRFGDLHNYYLSGIRNVVGIDPDKNSIEEARNRYNSIKSKYKDLKVNLIQETVSNKEIEVKGYFDIIVCNFTLHYLFESREMLENSISNISQRLSTGGYFVGTTIVIDSTFTGSEKVLFEKGDNFESDEPFGRDYQFKLLDNQESGNYFNQIENQKEYRVDIPTLEKICNKFNLKLVTLRDFDKVPNNRTQFSKDEKLVSSLYKTFVFVKTPSH